MARKPNTTPQPEPASDDQASPKSRPFGFASWTIFGRLAGAPELKYTPSGKPVTKTSLAINDRSGQAHYLDITLFGASAETLAKYATKGRGLIAYGRLATHTWETPDGSRRKMVDLIADDFHFAERAPAAAAETPGDAEDIPF